MKIETVIHRARNAIGLIIDGAVRHIETGYGPNESEDRQPQMVALFDVVQSELDGWETPDTENSRRRNLVDDMRVLLGADTQTDHREALEELLSLMPASVSYGDIHAIVAALLSRNDLLP